MTVSAKTITDLEIALRHRKMTIQPNKDEETWINRQTWRHIEEITHLLMSRDGNPPLDALQQAQLDADVTKFIDATRYSMAGYISISALIDNMRNLAVETVGHEVDRGVPLAVAQANCHRSLYRIEELNRATPKPRVTKVIPQGITQKSQTIAGRSVP